jgi:tRNA threonylcarbamoyladenosine biosynthesis protein TsaE
VTPAPLVARTASPEETRRLAAALAGGLGPGDLLLLVGDLGAGKTTFTQGLARGLGVTDPVTSPTFTLVRAYPCLSGPVRTLLHADLYRLDRLQDVVDLGLAEMAEDESVAVVEWGDVASSVFGPDVLTVSITADPDNGPPSAVHEALADEERTVTLGLAGSWSGRRSTLAERLAPWRPDSVGEGDRAGEGDSAAGGTGGDGA